MNDLNLVLRMNRPIVPEAVQLNQRVQHLDQALDMMPTTPARRSARIQAKAEEQGERINYREMNEYGIANRGRNPRGGHAE